MLYQSNGFMQTKILNFQIIESLYENENIRIFRALNESTQQHVVLKLLKGDHHSVNNVSKLIHSSEIIKNLNIPGIVRPLGIMHVKEVPMVIFEDFESISLTQYLKKTPLELKSFLKIAISLADTLGALHHHNIIHKDIKPQNILINPETLEVKITDFSIASFISHENPKLLNRHLIEGTLDYISPEQTGRMNRDIDNRTDIYSLGVTLYFALTGQLPFHSQDALELIHLHLAKLPQSPHQLQPSIPKAISGIIMKCLAKIPEDRYHSAYGLKNDLEACLKQLVETGNIPDLVPGALDIHDHFLIPQKLYGRNKDINTLMAAFDRICYGKAECIMISGYSGIGKTSLVMEIQKPIVKQRGYFITGKFDQLKRNMPFSGLIQAFRDLVIQTLTESETDLSVLKHKLIGALQNNGQVLIELIPELELIIGKQPPIPTLATQESQNRLRIFLRKFLSIFAKPEHPVVIFLDDLQWATSASLTFLKEVATDPGSQNLLLVGSYRDHEVTPSHPLILLVDELAKEPDLITQLTLQPLTIKDTSELIADTLHSNVDKVQKLANVMHQKSAGNPFFLTQLLKKFHKDQFFFFDLKSKTWAWDLEKIEHTEVSENVADLMIQKIQLLDPATQAILFLAAALGPRFDLQLLSIESNLSLGATFKILKTAISEELVQPIGENYHLIESEDLEKQNANQIKQIEIPFRFLHDRIQQAAYSIIGDLDREKIHYTIGRIFLKDVNETDFDNQIFKVLSHLNLAINQLKTEEERQQLLRLNLRACRIAKKAVAYQTAYDCINISKELLPKNSWQIDYELTYNIYLELAECSYLLKQFDNIDDLSQLILKHARSKIDKGNLYILKMAYYTGISSSQKAITEGLECLALFDIHISEHPSKARILFEFFRIKLKLRKHSLKSIETLPAIQDEEKLFIMRALIQLCVTTYLFNKHLLCMLTFKMVSLSIEYGSCDCSFFAFISYAGMIEVLFRDYKTAFEFAQIGIRLSDKFGVSGYQCRANYSMAIIFNHWINHYKTSEIYMDDGYTYGMESGEIMIMSFIGVFYGFADGLFLKNVDQAFKKMHRYKNLIFSCRNKQAMQSYIMKEQLLLGLHNRDFDGSFISNAEFDEIPYYENLKRDLELKNALQSYTAYRTMTFYLFGMYDEIEKMSIETISTREAMLTMTTERDFIFYRTLMLIAKLPKTNWWQKRKKLKEINSNIKLFKKWAKLCPDNNAHRLALIQAELARINKDYAAAEIFFDSASRFANQYEFTLEEGLALELAGKFYAEIDKLLIAKIHLQLAHSAYIQAQTFSKVRDLEEKYPGFLETVGKEAQKRLEISKKQKYDTSLPISTTGNENVLDLNSIMQAASILSGEIHLNELLSKMLKVAIENAGADKAIFIMEQQNRWLIQGEISLEQAQAVVLQAKPFENSADILSVSIVQYVIRTKQTVVLDDAMHLGIFTEDPYINHHKIKSVLCLPIIHQSKLSGILYFENNSSTDAFTADRLGILRLLSSEIATAIRNASLYSDLEKASENLKSLNAQLQYYNRNLENKVSERTHELQEKNEQLSDTLESLQEMQKQIIQQEKLASLGALTQGIAHEIKNPLNFINNFSSLSLELIEDLKKCVPETEDPHIMEALQLLSHLHLNLEKIHTHSIRMDGIVVSMLSHSKDSKGQKEPTNLNHLLKEYATLAIKSFEQKHPHVSITIETEFDSNLQKVSIVSQDIGRALMNIFDNAFYAVLLQKEVSGGEFIPSIKIASHQLSECIEISIQDNGVGIPEENRLKIFQPFFTTKPTGTGTGLGLSIAYDIIVHEHNGEIKVNSTEGKLTEFLIRLPFKTDHLSGYIPNETQKLIFGQRDSSQG